MLFFVVGAVFGEVQVSLFVAGAAGGLRFAFSFSDHSRIMLGSFSDRPRIGNDVSPVFKDYGRNFKMQFCVTRAVFGEVRS